MKLIFLGPQGSGKSTQAGIVASQNNIPQIEMGQILRDKALEEDEEAQLVRDCLSKGELVPNHITINALDERLKRPDCQNGYLLDGFPRNQEQLGAIKDKIDRVFYVKIPDEVAIERLTKRGRHDDTKEILKKRLEIYHNQTEPLLSHFKSLGILEEVNGQNTIEEVAMEIKERLKNVQ